MNPVHFSSDRQDWGTPKEFFERLDSEFKFEIDVCATAHNAKCDRYFTPEQDGLSQQWQGSCWMNPPYGRQSMALWMRKAYQSAMDGATVVCLVPARTDTAWWHEFCSRAEVRFIKGRLKFEGAPHNAPFPCAVIVFRPPSDLFDSSGWVRYWKRTA